MKKVGIFYGPVGGSTERIAKKIAEAFGANNADLIPIRDCKAADVEKYQNIIFGCSTIGKETWDADRPKPDWDAFRSELDNIKFANRKVALFGLGDHITYALHFVDSMGEVAKIIAPLGADIVGKVPTCEYDFRESEAVIDGEFIGLPIDEDFEAEKTDARIKNWVLRLKNLFE